MNIFSLFIFSSTRSVSPYSLCTQIVLISSLLLNLIACDETDVSRQLDLSINELDSGIDQGLDPSDKGSSDDTAPDDSLVDFTLDLDLVTDAETERPLDQGIIMDAEIEEPIDQGVTEPTDMIIPIDAPLPPSLDHLDTVIDLAAPDQRVWAQVIHVTSRGEQPLFISRDYTPTQGRADFWPASTIKMYTATATLELINQAGFSIDATLGFQRLIEGEWVEEVDISVREVVRRTFDCSSNETYTLLLRFTGVDWLNTEFFTPAHGFNHTALMRDYVTDDARPWSYQLSEAQRISIREGSREVIREHQWSGRSYADERGCTIYNTRGDANCTSAGDMAEHMRRVIFHEQLPEGQRFEISAPLLDWYRGDTRERILNNTQGDNCGGPVYSGIRRVFNQPILHHKEGLVSEYRGTMHHVHDEESNTEYVASLMIDSPSEQVIEKLSEELARMMKTPSAYVHLGYLRDYVNPITANLVTYSEEVGTLQMMVKPYEEDGFSLEGWTPLQGTSTPIDVGERSHNLRSNCLNESGQLHIRGRLETANGIVAWSDLHYVIVDHTQTCP